MTGTRINVGPLTSFNSLVFHLSNELKNIREAYMMGDTIDFFFDLTSLRSKTIHISAVTAFLSVGKKLSDFVGYPIPAFMLWEPEVLHFLNAIGFFEISARLKIFKFFPEGIIGGFRREKFPFNPNTKIIYYADVNPIRSIDPEYVGIEKAEHKQKISGNFKLLTSNIFKGVSNSLESKIVNASLELIVNSLMHAEEIAFVGLQRTKRKIVVTICDAGIGFPRALSRIYKEESMSNLSHAQGIFIGSLIQKKQHGLRLAISEILTDKEMIFHNTKEDFGWVIVSSYNTEFRWERNIWNSAMEAFDKIDVLKMPPDIEGFFGKSKDSYIDRKTLDYGYWKQYEHFLVGTRISFEIVLNG